jgi:hypothetical protein
MSVLACVPGAVAYTEDGTEILVNTSTAEPELFLRTALGHDPRAYVLIQGVEDADQLCARLRRDRFHASVVYLTGPGQTGAPLTVSVSALGPVIIPGTVVEAPDPAGSATALAVYAAQRITARHAALGYLDET